MPYLGEEIIPLVRPSDLQLVRVRRQHILDYKMAARTKRPEDLYTDSEVGVLLQANPAPSTTSPKAHRAMQKRALKPTVEAAGDCDSDIGGDSDSLGSEREAVRELQHMHRPLAKRRRVELTSDSEVASSDDNVTTRERGIVFHPSPTGRRAHNAVVRGRHKGKVGQTLLQSAQLCGLDFIGTPPVLQGAYHFGFGVGLSIMHFRRALQTDDIASTEKGVNMWDFSSRNSLPPPPKAVTFSDLIGALSAFYKFAKYFYNKDVKRFIGKARDFVIAYADNASHDSAMPRLLTHWVNSKFGNFRSRLATKGINSALRVAKEFSRNFEQLLALKEAAPTWGQKKQNTFHPRINMSCRNTMKFSS